MGHLRLVDLAMMALYAAVMLLIAAWFGRRRQSSEDYFVAGRGARSWVVGLSIFASLFSTVSFLSYPGELITYGTGMAWAMLHSPISYLIVGYLVIPHIMKQRVTTGYELLDSRFGPAVRKTTSALFIVLRLLWMSFVVFLCAGVMAVVAEIPPPYVIAAIGIVATLATVLGGIRAVLMVNVLQFAINMASGLIVILYVVYRCGGFGWLWHWDASAVEQLHWQHIKVFSLDPFDRITVTGVVLSTVLWWVCTATSDQIVIQRYLCTRDVRAARRSFLTCLLGDFLICVMMWGIAAAILAYFVRFHSDMPNPAAPLKAQADRLFPHFIAAVLPAGVRGVIVAALFADAMQCLSSGISALGTVLVVDFAHIFARGIGKTDVRGVTEASTAQPEMTPATSATDRRLARRAKFVGLGIGVVVLALTFVIAQVPGRNIVDVTLRINGFLAVPMFVVFALAFFVPFATPAGAWAAIAVGLLSGTLFTFWAQLVGRFTQTSEFSVFLIMPAALVCSLAAGILVSRSSRPRVNAAPLMPMEATSAAATATET
jgi:SSS family solute:Na+ symporter